MSADRLRATVCVGVVMHERVQPVRNRFVYPLTWLRIPLSSLDTLRVPMFGINRAAVFSLHNEDHGPRDGSPLLPWIRALLARHGLADVVPGEVVLHTMPRMFGYVFNPVSFWFCHDHLGRLRVVLAEVSNTFGERHNYLIHHRDLRPIASDDVLGARKVFHVSPFFPVSGEYRFRFDDRGAGYSVAIDYLDEGCRQLVTRISGRAQPLDGRALRRWLLRQPWSTLSVIVRIHVQAARLWLRKVRFFRKPPPPLEETTS